MPLGAHTTASHQRQVLKISAKDSADGIGEGAAVNLSATHTEDSVNFCCLHS